MTNFTIEIAGRIAAVSAQFPSTETYCQDYLCPGQPDFSVTVTPADIAFEREKSAAEDRLEGKIIREFSDAYLETVAVQRKLAEKLFDYDTLLFHGSVVAMDGQAYLFTAKSGTGKSTHTRLWRELLGDRVVMVNDDKPFLRFSGAEILACGSPWNGKHGLGNNICVPLKAVCILERGAENRIHKITPREALTMLLQQSNRPMDRKLLPKYLELIDRLAGGVEFFRLACNMDPRAAQISYNALSGEGKDE